MRDSQPLTSQPCLEVRSTWPGLWAAALWPRPWVGDECRLVIAGCERTPRPSGLCDHHERWLERFCGMTLKAGTHIRSLRMPPELAAAVSAASRTLNLPENQFICQAVREVLKQAGIAVEGPVDLLEGPEDPFR